MYFGMTVIELWSCISVDGLITSVFLSLFEILYVGLSGFSVLIILFMFGFLTAVVNILDNT